MVMPKGEYEIFEALNPFFEVVMEGLRGLLDGDYYFDTIAEDAFFEFRYRFPGWLTAVGSMSLTPKTRFPIDSALCCPPGQFRTLSLRSILGC
jgi:hypothetical protein